MNGIWPRLRIVSTGGSIEEERLALAKKLESGKPLTEATRRRAAHYLREGASDRPKLRGHPRDSQAPDIALDYRVQRELFGKGKSEDARKNVGRAWCVSPRTVGDAFTNWRTSAEWRLNQLVGDHPSDKPRDELLRLLSLDLRDYGSAEREARSRKKHA